jgi:hypothetical protein
LYTPDRSALKELKLISQDLDCHFSDEIERFVITYKRATGSPVEVLWIENPDGSFKQFGMDDVQKIASMDTNRDDVRARLNKSSFAINDFALKQKERTREEILAMTREDRRILMKAFNKAFLGGKADPYRKIEVKSRGVAAGK